MTPEISELLTKEWYWIVIIGAIAALAFCPSFLKGKCPGCRKRALTSFVIDDAAVKKLKDGGMAAEDVPPYTNFYRCGRCGGKYKRARSGPLQDASGTAFDTVFTRP
jgi:hypothetical protein